MAIQYSAQATTSREQRSKAVVFCAVLLLLILIALGLAVYDIIKMRWFFVAGYAIGIFLAAIAVVMRMNTVFPTKITADRRTLTLVCWDNMLLPYNTHSRLKLIREIIPAKICTKHIPIDSVSDLYIGTKSYLARSSVPDFNKQIAKLVSAGDLKRLVKTDLFCVLTLDGKFYMMSIDKFDERQVSKIVTAVMRSNPQTEFHTGSKKYRVFMRK